MSDFPVALTNAVGGAPPTGTLIMARHINNLEAKVGIDGSAVTTSLDYLLKNVDSVEPGHKHTKLLTPDGLTEVVTVDASGTFGVNVPAGETPLNFVEMFSAPGGGDFNFTALVDPVTKGSYVGLFFNVYNSAATPKRMQLWEFFSNGTYSDGGVVSDQFFGLYNSALDTWPLTIDAQGNILLYVWTTPGTNAQGNIVLATGVAPTTAPANLAQIWVEDVNAAAGKAGLHMMAESGTGKLVILGIIIKANTGDPAQVHEGLGCINTYDNTFKVYADGAWRTLASGW